MESINSIFLKNSYVTYPGKAKKTNVPKYGDIFETKNRDTLQYLDILYSDKTDNSTNVTNLTELLKTYLPIKSQNLHFGENFL